MFHVGGQQGLNKDLKQHKNKRKETFEWQSILLFLIKNALDSYDMGIKVTRCLQA